MLGNGGDSRISRRGMLERAARLGAGLAGLSVVGCQSQQEGGSMNGAKRLDRVAVDGRRLVDSSGRQITLRGLVTITSNMDLVTNKVEQVSLQPSDYKRMKAWGFDAQCIRMEGGRLGADPDTKFEPEYLDKIDSWATMAAAEGIYTNFKMTTYDIPSWGAGKAFDQKRWQEFWDNKNGQQDVFLSAWQRVWERFAGRPEVLGFDVINEPHLGTSLGDINKTHVFPFHRRASKLLREIDGDSLYLFQIAPMVQGSAEPLDDPHPLFAAHLYAQSLADYDKRIAYARQVQEQTNAPMLVGEYGHPEVKFWFFTEGWSVPIERKVAAFFDVNALGCTRVWYIYNQVWRVLEKDGSEHVEKMNVVVRPYPQRIAGSVKGWSFDFDSKRFEVAIEPSAQAKGSTEVYVPLKRHYANGFKLDLNGRAFVSDQSQKSGLRAEGGAKGASFDFESEMLRLDGSKERLAVSISPL